MRIHFLFYSFCLLYALVSVPAPPGRIRQCFSVANRHWWWIFPLKWLKAEWPDAADINQSPYEICYGQYFLCHRFIVFAFVRTIILCSQYFPSRLCVHFQANLTYLIHFQCVQEKIRTITFSFVSIEMRSNQLCHIVINFLIHSEKLLI